MWSRLAIILLAAAGIAAGAVVGARLSDPGSGVARQPDWERLRTMPLQRAIADGALSHTLKLVLERERDAAEAAIEASPADLRTLLWLTVLAKAMGRIEDGVDHGLHTFFFLNHGAFAPQIRRSLAEAGLVRQAEIFGRVMALFGEPYPRDRAVRERPFAWSRPGTRVDEFTTIPNDLNAFDLRLIDMSRDFGSKPEIWGEIEAFVRRVPALTAWAEEARAAISDEERVHWLAGELAVAGPERMVETMRDWPRPYRLIYLIDTFNDEMLNGSVHQFFFNSSGSLAPEVVAALREAGLAKHADAVQRGIDLFRAPYPTDTERRRDLYFRHEETTPFDEALTALTGDVDDGAILDAMIALAKRDGVLPR